MGEFGWAYISGSAPIQQAGGASGSVQFANTVAGITGSTKLVYQDENDKLVLTGSIAVNGSVIVAGDITASNFVVQNVSEINSAGSSKFGNSSDDKHEFTGSLLLAGAVSSSAHISASTFVGDGSNLTGVQFQSVTSPGQYRLLTNGASATVVQGESGLTWQGSTLSVQGSVSSTSQVSGNTLVGAGGGITALNATNVSAGTLNNARLPTTISVTAITSSTHVKATSFHGDGSALTGITSVSIANDGANRLIVSDGDGTFTARTGLSHNGTTLTISDNTIITGSLTVSGTITANKLNITSTGSTVIGNDSADTHQFTGSVFVKGPVSSSGNVSGSAFYGDGSNLTGINAAVNTYNSAAQYRLITSVNSTTIQGESGLTWQGANLDVAGTVRSTSQVSGNTLIGAGGGITALNATNISAGTLDNARLPSNISVTNLAGAGASITALNASNINAGTLNNARLPADISVTEVTGSKMKLTGLSAATAVSSKFLALDSNNNVVLTSSGGGSGGGLGAAEDASYTDGLFTDFTTSTSVGTAVDKFNEVLKILAPSPAPGVQHIGVTTGNGVTAKLAFGSSAPVTNITSSGTSAGWSAVDRNSAYAPDTDGFKRRLGVYNNSDITGIINYDIAASITNGNYAYREDSFGNGDTGILKLELNGEIVHSINLATFSGAGTPPNGTDDTGVNGNGSGFLDVSTAASTLDGNGADWGSIFKYRSAEYVIRAADQKRGWNYLRVIHTVGSTDAASNYIEWINDPAAHAPALSVSNARIENVSLIGSKYFSGVKYNTDATANYKVDLNNMYRNVFPNGGTPISFTATNSANPSSVAVPDLGGGENNTKVISLTAGLDCNVNTLLNGAISCNVSATHPLKTNLNNAGSVSAGGFLIDNRTLNSDTDTENFHDESFRKTSGSYDTQAAANHADSIWNSQTQMTAGSHGDGLLFYDQTLRSPKQGANNGNFAGLTNGPAGNPNYSGVSGARTFYRVVSASSGQAYDIRITTAQNGTTFNNSSLGTANAHMFVKIPGVTGWMDATQTFTYGQIADGNGALNPGASNTATVRYLTFGTASCPNGQHIMVKVVADSSWAGYISSIEFDPALHGASNAATLTTLDVDNSGTAAKLSFGASNGVSGYTNVAGSGVGDLSNVDSNAIFNLSGRRRAIFSSYPTITGDVNGDSAQFRNAYTGSLILEVNGIETASVNLNTFNAIPNGAGYQGNGNGTGFDLTAVNWRTGTGGAYDYRYPYRTGKYQIATGCQRLGWNIVRVIHRVGGSDTTTAYGEWVVDTAGAGAMSATSVSLSNFNNPTTYYQSGVRYFAAQPSGSYSYTMSGVYTNVYYKDNDGITFPTSTNCSITNTKASGNGVTTLDASGNSKSLPALDNSANCEQQDLDVTGTVLLNNVTSISGAYGSNSFTKYQASVSGRIKHPFKSNVTTSTVTSAPFLKYSGSIGSTNLNTDEYFNTEDYRIVSGAYANQAATTSSANAWNPQTHMNAANAHGDGMVTVSGYAISPLKIGNAGDARNIADGGSLQCPAGGPNYSSLTDNVRTVYRRFQNNSSNKAGITLNLFGDANLVAKTGTYAASLGANKNIFVELKCPYDPNNAGADDQSMGWADCAKIFESSNQPNNDGAGVRSGDFSGEDQTVDGGGLSLSLTFGTRRIKANQHFIIKISAHKDWTGYLSRVQVVY